MTRAIQSGIPKLRIEEAAARAQAWIDSGRQTVVGLNKYRPTAAESIDVLKVDNTGVRETQIANLKKLRLERDAGKVAAALNALTEAARIESGNLLELALDAARARATVGEMSLALERVFGRYQAPVQVVRGVYGANLGNTAQVEEARGLAEQFQRSEGRRPRILVAKIGQDGHDRGQKVIASAFADLGFDVDIGPLFQSPEETAKQAVENDVHIVGVSSLAAGHLTLVPQLRQELNRWGRDDILIVVGGVIPPQDHPALLRSGAADVFGPGTVIGEAALKLIRKLSEQTSEVSKSSEVESMADKYFTGVRSGDVSVLARVLTLIESSNPRQQALAESLLSRLWPHTGKSIRVGITGVPGVGKSTFIEALGMHLVHCGLRVAVLAVDPSSGISGGSILGDKTRMPGLSAESAAYIRPSPAAGSLGGVARKTRECVLACEAAGYQVVLIETVGVGQSETVVADMTDCFVSLMLPGAGDELQGIKRGLLEYVDVIAVNKADGATQSAAELAAQQYRLALGSLAGQQREPPPVLLCSALQKHGIEAVWDAIERRYSQLAAGEGLADRRRRQNIRWLWALVDDRLRESLQTHPEVRDIRDDIEREMLAGAIAPTAAAQRLLETFGLERREQLIHKDMGIVGE